MKAPKVGEFVQVVSSAHSQIQAGMVGEIVALGNEFDGLEVRFKDIKHPMDNGSVAQFHGKRYDPVVFLKHGSYKTYVKTETADANPSTSTVTSDSAQA